MKIINFLIVIVLISLTPPASAAFDKDNYDWDCQYHFPCTRLQSVTVNGEWDHSVYYFHNDQNDNRCLVIACHGGYDNNGYFIEILGSHRHDYANAISETLAWHYKNNYINPSGKYNYIFLTTCYSGYAQNNSVNLPVFNIACVLSNQNKYPNGFVEKYDTNGNVNYLELWYATPKSMQLSAPSGNLPMKQSQSKRGKAPEGLRVLNYGEEN